MVSELSVIIKDEEKKLTKKFLIYDTYSTDEKDPVILSCIDETLKNFDGEPTDVKVNIKIEIE